MKKLLTIAIVSGLAGFAVVMAAPVSWGPVATCLVACCAGLALSFIVRAVWPS